MRRFQLAAVTFLQGAVACSSYETSDTVDAGAGKLDGGVVVDTPVAPGDPSRTCVPRPPGDWQGPLILFEATGSPPAELAACPSGYRADSSYDGNADLVGPDAACECACGPETGAACSAKVKFFKDKACSGPCATVAEAPLGATCSATPSACGGGMLAQTLTAGQCAPTLKSKTSAPPSWTTRARACAPLDTPEAGCAADRVAAPTVGVPFATNTYCVAHSGDSTCPPLYPQKHVYYSSITDKRDCDCACAAPKGGSCAGVANTADVEDCASAAVKQFSDQCGELRSFASFTSKVVPGQCEAEGHPKGSATPATPTTICCTR